MLTRYLQAAMHRAHYEFIAEDGTFYGHIPGFDGVWATAATLEAGRDELTEVLEARVVLGLRLGHRLPEADGITLKLERVGP
jgi:predicted RNase H-like HicB family nuclease